jgi:hypothetical protein
MVGTNRKAPQDDAGHEECTKHHVAVKEKEGRGKHAQGE